MYLKRNFSQNLKKIKIFSKKIKTIIYKLIHFNKMPKKQVTEKKKPIIIIAMILGAFTLVAFINATFTGFSQITGFTVYDKLSSIFSGNTLSTIGAPMLVLTMIIAVSAVALKNIVKD